MCIRDRDTIVQLLIVSLRECYVIQLFPYIDRITYDCVASSTVAAIVYEIVWSDLPVVVSAIQYQPVPASTSHEDNKYTILLQLYLDMLSAEHSETYRLCIDDYGKEQKI